MARGWRQMLEEPDGKKGQVLGKFEKMRKEKRSVRGRTVDDWIVDDAFPKKNLREPKLVPEFMEYVASKNLRLGRVIEVHKRNVFVAEEKADGNPDTQLLWLCSVAKRHFQRAHKERNFVVVGDRVLFEPDVETKFDAAGEPTDTDLPRGAIQQSFARHSKISRRDPMNKEWQHVMLANIDLVCVVASVLHPEVRWGLIDRFLVQAEQEELPVVVVLNKVDLLGDGRIASPEFVANYAKRVGILREVGYEVIEVCALKPKKTPAAVARLRELFKGKLVGFCGHSGVGKSSILNLMKPEFEQIVDDNPEIFYKGRHTTTYNSLLALGIGAYAIDTPGVRSFAIDELDPITLSNCFPEFRGRRCKYRECSHFEEPECAIREAAEQGSISKERYRSYQGLLKGISFREGEGDATDAPIIADLKARVQMRDQEQLALLSTSAEGGAADEAEGTGDSNVAVGLDVAEGLDVAVQRENSLANVQPKADALAKVPKNNRLARLLAKKASAADC